MGALLSKEGEKPDPPEEVVEPKNTETNGKSPTSDSQALDKTVDIPKTDVIENNLNEEKVVTNQQTQEEVKSSGNSMASQQATDSEKSSTKDDDRQELNNIDKDKMVKSNETTNELNEELMSGVQPSPCFNALQSTSDTKHDSIQPKQQSNVYYSVKSTLNDEQLNQNKQQSDFDEPGKKESQDEVELADVQTNGADNKIQEPALTRRMPEDDVQTFIGTKLKPMIGITEERPPKLIHNPSIRAEKTQISYQTKPINLNYNKKVPLSFVWTVPIVEKFPNKLQQPYKKPGYSTFSRLLTHSVAESAYPKEQQGMRLKKQTGKTYLNPAAAIAWTIPDEKQEHPATVTPVDLGKTQVVPVEKQIETKVNTVSAFTWTIPSKTQEQNHPTAKAVNSEQRYLQLEEQTKNEKTNNLAGFAWTVPVDIQEKSKTKVKTEPILEVKEGKKSEKNPAMIKFDVWWPSAQSDSLQQSVNGAPTPNSFLNPSSFQLNVEKHISIYSSEMERENTTRKILANGDHVEIGVDEDLNEIIGNKVKSAWDASKRRQIEDYMDYQRGFRIPSQSTQPSSLESGGSNDSNFGQIQTQVVGEYNLRGNVHSPQNTITRTENKTFKFDPITDPVPYSKNYLQDGEPPLSRIQHPVKPYIPAKPPSESMVNSEVKTPRNWTPGRNVPEFQEVSKEDVLAGLKSHQEINKLSPLADTGTRSYARERFGVPRWHENQPLGYQNTPGRENQPLGYQHNSGRENQPIGYQNNPGWEKQPLRYHNNPGRYRPGNNNYQNRESNLRSKSQTHRFSRYESPSEFNNSSNAPELVRLNSIRHEHLENDNGFLST